MGNILSFLHIKLSTLFIALIPAGFFMYTLKEYQAIQMLFLVLAVDILLGSALAIKFKRFSSLRFGACIPRMIGYMSAIILLTVIMRVLPEAAFLFYYTLTIFIFREIVSHLENLSLLGIAFPEKVMKLLNADYNKDKELIKWHDKNKSSF